MEITLTNSHRFQFRESKFTSRNEKPTTSISESLTGYRLPEELITEILLCLPVKYLLNWKCVSKSWLSLISSPQFIRSHFSKSSRKGEYFGHQLLFTIHDPAHSMKQCSLYCALHEADPSAHVSDIEYPSKNPDGNATPRIVGIVNGLVCLAINEVDLFLWNPVLRKSKHLPCSHDKLKAFITFVNYSFGYDELNDDYKVVCLLNTNRSSFLEFEVNVYSLRDNSWRRIEDLKGFCRINDSGSYANGKIYWTALEVPDPNDLQNMKRKIVSLDMATEKYGELKQPIYKANQSFCVYGALGEPPFVYFEYEDLCLWFMEKYGVEEESWCNVVSIPKKVVFDETRGSCARFLCILSNNEVVVYDGLGLFVYHSKHKELRKLKLDVVGTSSEFEFEAVAYVESLVSPYG